MSKLLFLSLALPSLLISGACQSTGAGPQGNDPNVDNPSKIPEVGTTGVRDRFSLRPKTTVGERIRTTRVLNGVDDSNPDALLAYASQEVYTQRVLAVQDNLPSKVERTYEISNNSVGTAGQMETQVSPLEGETLELTQHAGGLSVRVIAGQVPEPLLQKVLLVGFDTALLPVRDVGLGDVWQIDVTKNPGLDGLLTAFGLTGKSNVMTAQLSLIADDVATISLDWKVTGDVGNATAMVFRLKGEMLYEMKTGLIREVALNGGKRGSNGETKNQITMSIKREFAKGWYE